MADLNETHLDFYGGQGNKFCLHVKDIGLGMSSKLFDFFFQSLTFFLMISGSAVQFLMIVLSKS